ncbi:hypothetical protein WG909_05545 [Peptostreptococcaceae bacterium AGR-M142]
MTKKMIFIKKSIDGFIVILNLNIINRLEVFSEKEMIISTIIGFSLLGLNLLIFKTIDKKNNNKNI